ncbi:MAG TPA: 2,3,4,5-tetrahydropyridine-2,6-dicarboxylate N-succinyltransferase [Bacteroidetes bacterium]|nr:2,3,4,5-tetrahydropyridine-2,6-dicarboxylate N-succinyltransferase [Bacteroidota bacterium]
MTLRERIEQFFEMAAESLPPEAETAFDELMRGLDRGEIRAAEPAGSDWRTNDWVKKGILLGFRLGKLQRFGEGLFPFFDKHTFPLKKLRLRDGVRVAPGGTAIRSGSYVAPSVVIMPPAYVNVGAYVGEGTMIDSHALVGSCAQIGQRVHLSAGAQIGGVLEPVGARPVIIEDDVLVGGNCGVYEGTRVRRRAVLAAGTVLTRSVPVYDLVNGKVLRGSAEHPLEIPEGAVVVPGSRALQSEFARAHGLSAYAAIIVKYRDERTDAATALESWLR